MDKDIRRINWGIYGFFTLFMVIPLLQLVLKSLQSKEGLTLGNYAAVFSDSRFYTAIGNTVIASLTAAVITLMIAFMLAYTIHLTNLPGILKKFIKVAVIFPMFLPTITYGFVLMYSFGKQGLLTHFFGKQLFEVYGFNGLVLGYVIYTLPPIFLLLNNSFRYVDKELIIVSRLMQDSKLKSTFRAVVKPMATTLAGALMLGFVMCATDYGIPASISGTYEVFSTLLYEKMMGAIPDFNAGSVLSILMLVPAFVSVILLHWLEKFQVVSKKIHSTLIEKGRIRDTVFGTLSVIVIA